MSVRLRLSLAFACLALISLATALLSINALSQSNYRFTSYIDDHGTLVAKALEVRSAVNERAIAIRNLILVSSADDKRSVHEQVKAAHAHVQTSLDELQALVAADSHATEEDFAATQQLANVEALYGPVALDVARRAVAGETESAIEKLSVEGRPLLGRLITAGSDYAEYSDKQAQGFINSAQSSYEQARTTLISVVVASLVAAIVLALLLISSLMRALGAEPSELVTTLAGRVTPANHRIHVGPGCPC